GYTTHWLSGSHRPGSRQRAMRKPIRSASAWQGREQGVSTGIASQYVARRLLERQPLRRLLILVNGATVPERILCRQFGITLNKDVSTCHPLPPHHSEDGRLCNA